MAVVGKRLVAEREVVRRDELTASPAAISGKAVGMHIGGGRMRDMPFTRMR